ncbi:hypothetical protein [Desulfosporosinus sp. SB140]|uniref:hypothetical protein n=1 Tax=Desulfosporosinus paludis TaxID=3115649 RepID=UPI0038908507
MTQVRQSVGTRSVDGQPSGIKEEPVQREFKSAKDIITFWCEIYEEHYGRPYTRRLCLVLEKNSYS